MSAAWLYELQSLVSNLARRGLLAEMPPTRDDLVSALGQRDWLESAPDFRLLVLEDPSRCLVLTNDPHQTVLSEFKLPPFWGCNRPPGVQKSIKEAEARQPLESSGLDARWRDGPMGAWFDRNGNPIKNIGSGLYSPTTAAELALHRERIAAWRELRRTGNRDPLAALGLCSSNEERARKLAEREAS